MKRIIVVDDDQLVRTALIRTLKAVEGISVYDAQTPEDALAAASRFMEEDGESLELLLITDGNMVPNFSMDGDELVRHMRAMAGSALKGALLLSGRMNDWVAQAEACGYELHGKPLGAALLRGRVRALLNIPDAPP